MTRRHVWISSFELAFPPGHAMSGEGEGAFVFCLFAAGDEATAVTAMEDRLARDGYEIRRRETVMPHSAGEDDETGLDWDALAEQAKTTGAVVYSTFYVFDKTDRA
jgi:hypothetical protein